MGQREELKARIAALAGDIKQRKIDLGTSGGATIPQVIGNTGVQRTQQTAVPTRSKTQERRWATYYTVDRRSQKQLAQKESVQLLATGEDESVADIFIDNPYLEQDPRAPLLSYDSHNEEVEGAGASIADVFFEHPNLEWDPGDMGSLLVVNDYADARGERDGECDEFTVYANPTTAKRRQFRKRRRV
ncbi:Hypothetical predicted protein [Lecanosticta acicola]|uniref:Uncharacterized protein n=1 Tax=Lecanosticta acicola TaxID=111012 RepID=A0AAI8Z8N8_9PEZI|nr:Hypothetical predicted protein [Lecanosticta acicola]